MLVSFASLLLFQCLGEGITFAFKLPVPGPVVGMLLLFVALVLYPPLLEKIEATGSELLRHLSLLFVPAGVGIVAAATQLRGQWVAMIAALVVSTLLMRWQQAREQRTTAANLDAGDPDA